jgi:ABC-type sugar transport system permease subunit
MKTKNIVALIIFSVFVVIILGLFIAHIIKQCREGRQTLQPPQLTRENISE